jgi:hypothetical protein
VARFALRYCRAIAVERQENLVSHNGWSMRGFWKASGAMITAWACAGANAQAPQDAFARAVAAIMLPASAHHGFNDWGYLDSVKQVRWEPLPPNMLNDGLPDGAYFTRKGVMDADEGLVNVTATGVRTMVMNVYFRIHGAAMGEATALAALNRAGFALELTRCPIQASPAAGAKWWRLKGPGKQPAWFHSKTRCDGATCEGYALLLGETLASMTPQEQRLYTDQCVAGTTVAPPAPAAAWDEQLASLLAALIPPQGAAAVAWDALEKATPVRWTPLPPKVIRQPSWEDGNHHYREGSTDLGGRVLQVTATGTQDSVLNIYVQDQATQAERGDALMALWPKGYNVRLARCGKLYQLSTQTWYRVTGHASLPVMVQRGMRCDTTACPRAEESYRLAFTGALPPLQAGEVEAVSDVCPGR